MWGTYDHKGFSISCQLQHSTIPAPSQHPGSHFPATPTTENLNMWSLEDGIICFLFFFKNFYHLTIFLPLPKFMMLHGSISGSNYIQLQCSLHDECSLTTYRILYISYIFLLIYFYSIDLSMFPQKP